MLSSSCLNSLENTKFHVVDLNKSSASCLKGTRKLFDGRHTRTIFFFFFSDEKVRIRSSAIAGIQHEFLGCLGASGSSLFPYEYLVLSSKFVLCISLKKSNEEGYRVRFD